MWHNHARGLWNFLENLLIKNKDRVRCFEAAPLWQTSVSAITCTSVPSCNSVTTTDCAEGEPRRFSAP
ncbi:hypothetical protein HMPREF9120_01582 [Neisseria sp. oral taxon 020 str. F0370]|nr:hypothetical protein HMPREF9120_01582 [Neisseria sp. oral taxon 020 str. F0370]